MFSLVLTLLNKHICTSAIYICVAAFDTYTHIQGGPKNKPLLIYQ